MWGWPPLSLSPLFLVMFETFPKGCLVTFTFAAHYFTKSIFLYCVPTCYLSPCSVCLHWIIRGAHIQMSFIAICFTLYTVGPSSWWLQSYTAPSSPPTQHHDSLSNIYIIIIGNQSQSDSQIAIQQCIFGSFARCFLGSLRSFRNANFVHGLVWHIMLLSSFKELMLFDRRIANERRKVGKKEPLHCTNCTSFICDPTKNF